MHAEDQKNEQRRIEALADFLDTADELHRAGRITRRQLDDAFEIVDAARRTFAAPRKTRPGQKAA